MRRIAAVFVTFIAFFGILTATGGTAFAETSETSTTNVGDPGSNPISNMTMSWSAENYVIDPTTCQPVNNGAGSVSEVFDPTQPDTCGYPQEYYSCYVVDCGGVIASANSVKLNLITDQHFLYGFYTYVAINADFSVELEQSLPWDGTTLPFTKKAFIDNHWVTLTLQYADAVIYWDGQPVPPSCGDTAVGFCSMK